MSKQIMKPVWRANSGDGVPSDLGSDVLVNGIAMANTFFVQECQWSINDFVLDIIAYETNRTKAAKYERVECEVCGGFSTWLDNSGWNKCKNCNGKGYTLEAIK